MTTFTLTVDDEVAALIRRVAAKESKDETVAATQLLEWAAARRGATDADAPATDDWDDEEAFLKMQDAQIRQMFERNKW